MADNKIDTALVEKFYEYGWLGGDHQLTDAGKHALATMLHFLPPFHKGRWDEVFVPFMSKIVPSAMELVIIRDHKVLLTYRTDPFFSGWHTPGTYKGPGELRQETAQRCADKELKVKVRYIKSIGEDDHPDSRRFHDQCILALCEIVEGEPNAGQWFSEMPPDLIPEHRKYWPAIEAELRKPFGGTANKTNTGIRVMLDPGFLPPDYEG